MGVYILIDMVAAKMYADVETDLILTVSQDKETVLEYASGYLASLNDCDRLTQTVDEALEDLRSVGETDDGIYLIYKSLK